MVHSVAKLQSLILQKNVLYLLSWNWLFWILTKNGSSMKDLLWRHFYLIFWPILEDLLIASFDLLFGPKIFIRIYFSATFNLFLYPIVQIYNSATFALFLDPSCEWSVNNL